MNRRVAIVLACVTVALLAGCGRMNWARVNSDMTDEKISEVVSKRLQPGMSIAEVQDHAVWLRFDDSARIGECEIAIDPDWLTESQVLGYRDDWYYRPSSAEAVVTSPPAPTSTVTAIQWRLENSGFVWEFMVRRSEEYLFAVFDADKRLGAVYRTQMDGINGTDVLRRIPLTPEPAP